VHERNKVEEVVSFVILYIESQTCFYASWLH
jgi:hypothetical protein